MSALIHFLARNVACGPPDPSVASDRNDDDQAVTNRTGSMSEPNRADRIGTAPSTTQNGEVLLHDGLAPSLAHVSGATENGDSMIEIDEIVDRWSNLRHEAAEREAQAEVEREQFLQAFQNITRAVVRPAMEMAIERLRTDGGGGFIEQHEVDILHKPRVTLWMSMEGEISGSPRQDLNPFLQLDADAVHRRIDVWEGDMVDKSGSSAAAAPWDLSEVSSDGVIERIIGILRRAATHGVSA
jgi:hypothetical protein